MTAAEVYPFPEGSGHNEREQGTAPRRARRPRPKYTMSDALRAGLCNDKAQYDRVDPIVEMTIDHYHGTGVPQSEWHPRPIAAITLAKPFVQDGEEALRAGLEAEVDPVLDEMAENNDAVKAELDGLEKFPSDIATPEGNKRFGATTPWRTSTTSQSTDVPVPLGRGRRQRNRRSRRTNVHPPLSGDLTASVRHSGPSTFARQLLRRGHTTAQSLLIDRIHTYDNDSPLCGWDNIPDPRWPHRFVSLSYSGACLPIQLHTGDYTPPAPAPWLTLKPEGYRPPDLRPWEAIALLNETDWAGRLKLEDFDGPIEANGWWYKTE